ncbi:hypothetical protein K438DRAFT_2028374 [Mycena galopus ATCC 62051]|nr:hypothetical protein K438DRAFT_2028374 [Mycena galopus ATCC 62051]
MPIENEQEEYTLYMFEDHLPSTKCLSCAGKDQECVVRTWGRTCVACECCLHSTCFLLDLKHWEMFWEDNGKAMVLPFGKHLYTYEELQPHVPRAFTILHRWYFNCERRHFKQSLAGIPDLGLLIALLKTYKDTDRSTFYIQSLIRACIGEVIGNAHTLLASVANQTPHFAEMTSMFLSRKPSKACSNCAARGCECTFDCWAGGCRECQITLNSRCDFASLFYWQTFIAEDDKATEAYLASHIDYAREATLERYRALYPFVPKYFEASRIVGSFKTEAAYHNLLVAVGPEITLKLFETALEANAPRHLLRILSEHIPEPKEPATVTTITFDSGSNPNFPHLEPIEDEDGCYPTNEEEYVEPPEEYSCEWNGRA